MGTQNTFSEATFGGNTNSADPGAGSGANNLDDDTNDVFGADDDFAISFTDDEPLRGQNEADISGGQGRAASDADDLDQNPIVRERLGRERRMREAVEAQALRDQEALEAALLKSEKDKLKIQRDAFELSIDGIDVRIRTTTEALKAARQDGDVSAETDIEIQLRELQNVRSTMESRMRDLPSEAALDAAYRNHVEERRSRIEARRSEERSSARGSDSGPEPLNAKAATWQRNNQWMLDQSKVAETAALMAINNQLVKEGLSADDDRFFVELTRRMAKSFPGLPIKDLSGRQIAGAQQQARRVAPPAATAQGGMPPVAGRSSTAPGGAQRGGTLRQVELNQNDRMIMKKLGINVDDQKAVKYFAREKLARLRSEQGNRA